MMRNMADAIYVARCPDASHLDADKVPVVRIDFIDCSFIDPEFLSGLAGAIWSSTQQSGRSGFPTRTSRH